jgi:hypothetical protein
MVFTTTREFNVEGAPSAPLGIDPLAGKPILREDLSNAALERLVQQYVAAGMPEPQARRLAANQVKMYGPQGASGLADEHANDPAGVKESAAAIAEDDRRHAQMKADYDRATGLGPASPELEAQFADSERYSAEQGRLRRAGLHSQTPVDPGTPEQQASWNQFLEDNPDEMRRYRPQVAAEREQAVRAGEETAHAAMLDQKYGPGVGAKYLEAKSQGRSVGTDVIPVPTYSDDEMAQRREAAAASNDIRLRRRLIAAAGYEADPGEEVSLDDMRTRIAIRKQADREARERQWKAQVMLRAGNRVGALGTEGLDDWQRAAIAGGPTPLAVEAARAARQSPDNDVRLKGIEAQIAAANADREARANEFRATMARQEAEAKERAKQFDASQTLAMTRMTEEGKRQEAAIAAQLASSGREWDARRAMNTENAEVERHRAATADKKIDEQVRMAEDKARMLAEREARLRELEFQQKSPGMYDVISGRADTRDAASSLKAMAGRSDRFQWLPGGGFGLREATAMNDELLGLARQAELLGVQSPLTDPAYRRELIKRYGYASGWSGGRGGWFGDFWHPMPPDLR